MPRIYLDNAATSWPKPESVYQAVSDYQRGRPRSGVASTPRPSPRKAWSTPRGGMSPVGSRAGGRASRVHSQRHGRPEHRH